MGVQASSNGIAAGGEPKCFQSTWQKSLSVLPVSSPQCARQSSKVGARCDCAVTLYIHLIANRRNFLFRVFKLKNLDFSILKLFKLPAQFKRFWSFLLLSARITKGEEYNVCALFTPNRKHYRRFSVFR